MSGSFDVQCYSMDLSAMKNTKYHQRYLYRTNIHTILINIIPGIDIVYPTTYFKRIIPKIGFSSQKLAVCLPECFSSYPQSFAQ